MQTFESQARIEVAPFSRQFEGDEVVIGRPETGVFLVLPKEGVGLLDDLAAGKTVGEVRELFRERHGEVPDMDDFLGYLESRGIIRRPGEPRPAASATSVSQPAPAPLRFHFAGFPESLARRLFGRAAFCLYGTLIVLAMACLIAKPDLWPGWRSLFFDKNLTLMSLCMLAFYYFVIFAHEMGHLVAAKSVGVGARIGIGHRLWTLVAETDMTGLWGIPKQKRYLPLLAGPLVDAISASLLVLVLFAHEHRWLELPKIAGRLVPAMLLVYMLSILWQCFFFVRTDFYYVISNLFNCKSLLSDTEAYLRNRLARVLKFLSSVDQSHLPPHEARVIRTYAWIWIGGRLLALWALLFIHVPLVLSYFRLVSSTLSAGYGADVHAYLDALFMATITILPLLAGLWLWLRSLMKAWAHLRARPGTES